MSVPWYTAGRKPEVYIDAPLRKTLSVIAI